eukprot:7216161-Lingulodinium_polyedra.AAC.1
MPMLRKTCRSGPRRPPILAATALPQINAVVTWRAQAGASHPSSTATSHRWPTRSNALSWSAR